MSVGKLRFYRFLYPGVFCAIILFFLLNHYVPDTNVIDNFRYYLFAAVFAIIYSVFGLRNGIWYKIILDKIIDPNIYQGMEKIQSRTYIEDNESCWHHSISSIRKIYEKKPKVNKSMRSYFFDFVNKYDYLGNLSNKIMINGLLLTCAIDSMIVIAMMTAFSLVTDFVKPELSFTFLEYLFLIGVVLLSMSMVLVLIGKHIVYGNQQLAYINSHYLDDEK